MIYVGIDVAKDKHDCFITNSDGEVLFQVFTIQNNREGFDGLFSRIQSVSHDMSNIKVVVLCQEKVQIKHAFFKVGLPCQSFCFFV